jgi:hypothetical protein
MCFNITTTEATAAMVAIIQPIFEKNMNIGKDTTVVSVARAM